ncbi:epoxyqueuosine reductase [Candidatus Fermentibacteria bacterium]|nr:epoxyqueuosine reductase [Candidatus Fermentibacteria bacterium]
MAVALDPGVVGKITEGPTLEYMEEYKAVNELLGELSRKAAEYLTANGFKALPYAATDEGVDSRTHSTELPHKTVATLAGLGWIGKCALLVTERYGSAVRIGKVLTDATLPVAKPVVESRCEDCTVCVDACPGGAANGRNWEAGLERNRFFDAHACRRAARAKAKERIGILYAICGMCIAACPWTRRYIDEAGRSS